jgi:hypothetical protein
LNAPVAVRIAANLARVCLHMQDTPAAQQVITQAKVALSELGACGQRLLIGSSGIWQGVYGLLSQPDTTMAPQEMPPQPVPVQATQPQLELCFLGEPTARLDGQALHLRRRFAEIIAVLAMHPEGLSGEQLTLAVYGDEGTLECCKTELSRLRQLVPIQTRPYRLGAHVRADFLDLEALLARGETETALAMYTGPLLPHSDAPAVVTQREHLEETVRQTALQSQDPNILWHFAQRAKEDLDLWQAVLKLLGQADPRRAWASTRMEHLRKAWST